jgi:DNA-binding transcriptional ArsR family regulator
MNELKDEVTQAIFNGHEGVLKIKGVDISHAGLTAILPTQPKCCGACAFRLGSEERSDPWRWLRLTERFEADEAFLCHEGIPGHRSQKDGAPLSLCAGRAALDGKPMFHLALIDMERNRMEQNRMTTQTALFPEDVCQANHGDNPESRAAFDTLLPHLSRLQEAVLGYIADRRLGATVKQVRRDLKMEHQTASARLSELRAAGLTEDTGRRLEGCQVHQASELGRRTLSAWKLKFTART